VNDLLEATRAHAAFLLRPGGNQVLANVGRVAELARTYESSGGISFRGFVEELTMQAEKEEASEAPVLEEDSDGIRLLTVHGAKGLEFPVVILADITAGLSNRDPDQYIDGDRKLAAMRLLRCAPLELIAHEQEEAARERAEGVRVAYVAATRARDLLVVPAVGDEAFPPDGWLSPLNKALYPSRDQWRESRPAEGCPKFGVRSVLERSRDYDGQPEFSVRPGLVEPERGLHRVVWWDPAALKLRKDSQQESDRVLAEVLKDDGGKSTAEYRAWQEERASVIHAGSVPSFQVFLASQASEQPPGAPLDVVFLPSARRSEVGGRRFGALVHAVLSQIPFDARAPQIVKLSVLQGRVLGAPTEEVRAAEEAVSLALKQPLVQRAAKAGRVYREYPFSLPLDERRLVEGVIDLCFVEDDLWVVVDFKTDAGVEGNRRQYERQLRWYVHALRELTGKDGSAFLMGV
jgi:ATP-dependent exoDNAse (exonuclease V) beta subunit